MPLLVRRPHSVIKVNPASTKLASVDRNVMENGSSEQEFETGCYHYENHQHAKTLLSTFDELRRKKLFTDVILTTGDREFPCHRIVLVSGSKYFRAMFCNDHRESRETIVEINGMQADTMELLLNFLYSSHASINDHNAQLLLEASNLFEIAPLRGACTRFIEAQLDPCNCIGMRGFAEVHGLSGLFEKATEMANEKFEKVVQHEEFLELSKDCVIEYISNDDINVSGEEIVYEAVKRWVNHDDPSRSKQFAELLSYVRLPLVHPTFFVNTIECDPQTVCNPSCQELLMETRKFHILGNDSNGERTRPRRSTGWSATVVIVGGYNRVGGYNTPYVHAYDPSINEWTSLAKLPTFTKSEYAVATFRNHIIISGGRVHSRDVWLYQSHINNWVKVAPLCKGRWRHQMTTLGGHVYCVGGFDGKKHLLSVEQYDSYSNSWKEISPLLFSMSLYTIASCQGKLYVIGTDDPATPCKMQVYNPEEEKWIEKSFLQMTLSYISSVTLNGKIYVVGGTTPVICCYNPFNETWTSTPIKGNRFDQCGVTVCGGKIYITGGILESGEASDLIYSYEPDSEQISPLSTMFQSSFSHGCVTIHRFSPK